MALEFFCLICWLRHSSWGKIMEMCTTSTRMNHKIPLWQEKNVGKSSLFFTMRIESIFCVELKKHSRNFHQFNEKFHVKFWINFHFQMKGFLFGRENFSSLRFSIFLSSTSTFVVNKCETLTCSALDGVVQVRNFQPKGKLWNPWSFYFL